MNWANRLTLSRLALTVLFVGLLSSSWHYARTAALVIFLIAGLTDFIDGEIARRYGHGDLEGVFLHLAERHEPTGAQQSDHP